MKVIVRTHGGLGNQLFQVLAARLWARELRTEWVEFFDDHYGHRLQRSGELGSAPGVGSWQQRVISSSRLPKVLYRLKLRGTEMATLLGDLYLDGYFQKVSDFARFSDAQVGAELQALRRELKVGRDGRRSGVLYHLRLGDFFPTRDAARAHALETIGGLQEGSTIITNQEDILREGPVQERLLSKRCVLLGTAGSSSEELLRLMSRYERIVTNNSTLAFWASVLGRAVTEFSYDVLAASHARLFKVGEAQWDG